jgi:hypothetical protein
MAEKFVFIIMLADVCLRIGIIRASQQGHFHCVFVYAKAEFVVGYNAEPAFGIREINITLSREFELCRFPGVLGAGTAFDTSHLDAAGGMAAMDIRLEAHPQHFVLFVPVYIVVDAHVTLPGFKLYSLTQLRIADADILDNVSMSVGVVG